MFFFVSKLLEKALLPSNVIGGLAALGVLLLLLHRPRLGRLSLVTAALLLIIIGWSPAGTSALMELENRFPRPVVEGDIAGIVVLGGEIDTHISFDRETVAINEAGERLTTTADLARRFPDARIILSGGISHLLFGEAETESALARDVLVRIGVPAGRIELEERSRNTCENAVESKAAADPKPGEQWILVTSANHMPRAVACFRAAMFPIIPYPVDYRTQTDAWRWPTGSVAEGLQAADLAAHEWIGLIAYSLARGTELFPSPQIP